MIGLLRVNRRNELDKRVALCALSFLISFCVLVWQGEYVFALLSLLLLYGLLKLFGH